MQNDKFGIEFGERWNLFIKSKNKNAPIKIENIGETFPNNQISINREGHDIFVVEYFLDGVEHLNVDGKEYTLAKGDLVILEPKIKHSYIADKKTPPSKKWINFSSSLFEEAYKSLGLNGKIIYKNINCLDFFDTLLSIAETTIYSDEITYDVAINLFTLLFALAKEEENKENKKVSNLALLTKELLDKAIYEKANLTTIFKDLFYSEKQITREFKKYFNDTPYNYLITIKINMAKRLLRTSPLSIKEIAFKLGFDNQHYFSNAFKKKTNRSPSDYRNKL